MTDSYPSSGKVISTDDDYAAAFARPLDVYAHPVVQRYPRRKHLTAEQLTERRQAAQARAKRVKAQRKKARQAQRAARRAQRL